MSNVTVTTVNASALLVSWNALQDPHLSHYTIYYSALLSKAAHSEDWKKVVKKFKKEVPSTNTSDIRDLEAGVEHKIHVIRMIMQRKWNHTSIPRLSKPFLANSQ